LRAALVNGAAPKPKRARKLRIGVARTHVWPQAQPEAVAMMEQAQRALDASAVELPAQIEDSMKRFGMITRYEGLRTTDEVVKRNIDQINPWSREGYEAGLKVTRADFDAAVREAQGARAIIARVFEDYDVLITPAATGEAPADLAMIEGGAFNSLWTHLYVPCVTIPAFVGPNGMPVGLQVVAAHGADEALLAAAGAIVSRLKQASGKLPIGVA
jgi:Asp-tRNA(Asn)/Glu-tRNA(Gln) amidotransferase A subunit family amidase